MRIPKFWARASDNGWEAPGWSFTSLAEAKRVAAERLSQIMSIRARGHDEQGHYLYGDRPVKEPIIETIGSTERPDAMITRNAYGALCLNTEDVVFVDVDNTKALDAIRTVASRQPDWGLRVYRTAAGCRVIATRARFGPASDEVQQMFEALRADPLYRKLCANQQSFRARLTPKPWRIELRRLPVTYPWRDADAEARVNDWVAGYDKARQGYAVCELVEQGPAPSDPVIAGIIDLHDRWTLAAGKPLA